MKKWLFIGILLVVVAAAIAIPLSVTKRHKQAPSMSLITVKRGDITQTAIAAGNILPRKTVTIKSDVSGTADAITVQAGDSIKKGQLLVKIKQTKTPEEVTTLVSDVATAKEAESSAKQKLENYQYLLKNQVIKSNYNDYTAAKADYQKELITYQLKKQQLDLYQNGEATLNGKLVKSEVTSTIDGYIILQRLINEGDAINSTGGNQAATPLFIVADMHDLIFQGAVDERFATRVKLDQTATITIAALPDVKITGKITAIALQSDQQNSKSEANTKANPGSGSDNSPFNVGFQIEIGKLSIPAHTQLLSGYSANATVTLQTEKNVLLIPERAVSINKDNQTVVTLYQGKDKPAKEVPVTLGVSDNSQVVVTQGVSEGDQLIDAHAISAGTP